jgi:hypothetical protein
MTAEGSVPKNDGMNSNDAQAIVDKIFSREVFKETDKEELVKNRRNRKPRPAGGKGDGAWPGLPVRCGLGD